MTDPGSAPTVMIDPGLAKAVMSDLSSNEQRDEGEQDGPGSERT